MGKHKEKGGQLEALAEMARAAQEAEHWDAAIKHWDQVILIDAKHGPAWLGKGHCLLKKAIEERPDEADGLTFIFFEKLLGLVNLGGGKLR